MKKHTRREFLENAILGAGAGVAFTAFAPGSLGAGSQPGEGRGYVAGKYGVELDGVMAGWIASVEGGHATSDVVNEKVGVQKHVAGGKYEDITLNCGTGMSKAFYDWIKSAFDRQYQRKNGAIIACDYNYKELTRMEFTGGLISEVGFPALDAASKDAAKMTVNITPESIRTVKGAGRPVGAPSQKPQKRWLPSNFRLTISGLDCRRVNKIEAITVKQKIGANTIGGIPDYQREPAHLEIPTLAITLPEADSSAFKTWRQSFVIAGRNVQGNQSTGQLEYLTPDLRETLFTLTFHNLGLFKLTPDKVEAGGENIRRVKAEMYCEDMKFTYGPAAWA